MWLAVDKNGTERAVSVAPIRDGLYDLVYWFDRGYGGVVLPKGTIKRLIGRELTWNDEPVEVPEYK